MTQPAVNAAAQKLYDNIGPLVADDELRGWAALYLVSAIGAMMQGGDEIVGDADDYPGWSRVLDPDECPASWLPWLAWLYGVTLVPGMSVQQQRDTIRDLPPHQRGTVSAFVNAGKVRLTGAKTVVVVERDSSAYHLIVLTRTGETPDPAGTQADLLAQKPGGLILEYAVVDGITWAEATHTWATVDPAVTWAQALTTPV